MHVSVCELDLSPPRPSERLVRASGSLRGSMEGRREVEEEEGGRW